MPSTSFVLKEPNGKNATLIYMIFRFNSQKLKYSTGLKIEPKFWSSEKQRAKETRQISYLEFNTLMGNLDSTVNNTFRKLINDKVNPTPELLRPYLDEVLQKKEINHKQDLIAFAEELIEATNRKPSTKKQLGQALRNLKEFKTHSRRSLHFEAIDLNFYDDYLGFLTGKNYGLNTIGTQIKNLKVFLNEAVDRNLTQNLQFKNRRFKAMEEPSENIYLTMDEIKTIYGKDLTAIPRLEKIRDLFVIACYTGLRFSDLIQLKAENLIDNKTKVKIKTEKTGELVIIPLHSFIKEILTKYKGLPPQLISNQKMNQYLKEIGEICELNDDVLISSTKGGIKHTENFKKYELITVHTARRSFATNAYLNNVPTISIMKITGHRTEKAFLRYIKISQEDNANKLLNHPFFN